MARLARGGGSGGWRDAGGPGDWLAGRLLDRRIVMIAGPLRDELATRVCAQVLALAERGAEPILLYLSGADGELDAAVTVMDALDAVGTPVDAVVTGHLGGVALGLLAVADRRRAYAHATFRLAEPRLRFEGSADRVAAEAARAGALLESIYAGLARISGRPAEELRQGARAGRTLTATEAMAYGLIEGILEGR